MYKKTAKLLLLTKGEKCYIIISLINKKANIKQRSTAVSETSKSYRIKKKITSDTFEIPRKLLSKMSEASDIDLKIFLVIASLGLDGDFTEESITAELSDSGFSETDIASGFAFLRGAGLIERATAKKSAPAEKKPAEKEEKKTLTPSSRPSYTSHQLAEASSKGPFKDLITWAAHRLGRPIAQSDAAILYSFIDYLCLPQDVVMLAIEHCVSEGKGSLKYIEKLLIDFADREINTYDRAEAYILGRKKYQTFEYSVRKLLGIGERALTSKEKAMVSSWQEWQVSDELLSLAYEKTVQNTKKASMEYMHKILENWHNAGFTTVAEVQRGDKKESESSAFDPDDFFMTAVESSKK